MSWMRIVAVLALVLGLFGLAAPAGAVGLFVCVDGAGRQVCVIDTGNMTNFLPSRLCNASCPLCAGRCDGAHYYPKTTGHWQKQWQVAPGMENNMMQPSGDMRQDARTIRNEGLVSPAPTAPAAPAN